MLDKREAIFDERYNTFHEAATDYGSNKVRTLLASVAEAVDFQRAWALKCHPTDDAFMGLGLGLGLGRGLWSGGQWR